MPQRVRVDGTELADVEQGAGAPVVFVHGAFSDARFWEPQRAAVAAHRRFIAYTARYHGTAPWSDDGRRYSAACGRRRSWSAAHGRGGTSR